MKPAAALLILVMAICSGACSADAQRRVVLVIAGGTGITDLTRPGLDNISRIFDSGSAALMNVRSGRGGRGVLRTAGAGMEAGCVGLGAGAMAVGGLEVRQAANSGGTVNGFRVEDVYRLSTGADPGGVAVLHTRIGRISRANATSSHRALPGALGSALNAAGLQTAVVGNSDIPGEIHREASAAAMNTEGRVDFGDVSSPALTAHDPEEPWGVRTDSAHLLRAVDQALREADFVVIDFGDTFRADAFSRFSTDDRQAVLRYRAVLRLDDFTGSLVSMLDFRRDTLVILSPVSPAWTEMEDEHLTYVVVRGPDHPRGILTSPSTRRPGIVTLSDVAPTVLALLGVPEPPQMAGRSIRCIPGPDSSARLVSMNRNAVLQSRRLVVMRWSSIGQSLLIILASAVLLAGSRQALRSAAGWVALAVASLPLAMIIMPLYYSGDIWGAAVVAVASTGALLTACAKLLRDPLRALAWLAAVFAGVLVLDIFLGATLTSNSIAGYSLAGGARYYGIGNELMGYLLGAVMVTTGIAMRGNRDHLAVTLLFGFVLLTIALPGLGANFGGALAAFFSVCAALTARRGWRPGGRLLLSSALVAALLVAGLFLLDALRSGSEQSHVGRVIELAAGDGASGLAAIVYRKATLNLRLLAVSPWSRLLAVSLICSLALHIRLKRSRGPDGLARSESASVLGMSVGVLGALVFNDSGVVAAATCSVFLWVLLALRNLHPESSGKELQGRLGAGPAV